MRTLFTLTVLTLALASCKKDEVVPTKPVEVVKAPEAVKAAAPATPVDGVRSIVMAVTDEGFVPANVTLKANEPVKFVVTRKTDETCATALLIDGTDIKKDLPLNQPVEIAWTPTKPGKVKFGCAMDMMIGGVLLVE